MIKADMHVHSYFSDGWYSPETNFKAAVKAGVDFLVITDHDNCCGYDEAALAAGKCGIKTTVGVEVSAYENGVKLHTLLYGADRENADFKAFMRRLFTGSLERCEIVLAKLKGEGVDISKEEVLAFKHCLDAPVHSFHIAGVGAKKGYAPSAVDFYLQYLAEGKAASSMHARPSPYETAEIGRAAGAVVSLAHPGRIRLSEYDLKQFVERCIPCGLTGIETYYTTHNKYQTAYFKEMARRLNLYCTGGSDAHFQDGVHCIGKPDFYPDESLLAALKIR